MANWSQNSSASTLSLVRAEREGYAWCANLSIDALELPEHRGDALVSPIYEDLGMKVTPKWITWLKPVPEQFGSCGRPTQVRLGTVRIGGPCCIVRPLPGREVAARWKSGE